MAHLPYVDRSAVGPEVAEALDGLPDLNLFRMLAHAETAFVPWLRYGGALLTGLALDAVERELAILRVAGLLESEYEWVQHAEIAERVGASTDQVRAVRAGELDSPLFDPGQQAVLRIATAVVERRALDAELLAAKRPPELVELLLVVVNYFALALFIAATGIETDQPAGLGR